MNNEHLPIIALVDDSPHIAKVTGLILRKAGYEILNYNNGSDFLSDTKSYEVDLVLLDVMMPGINGFETCKRFKSNPKSNKIPVIFTTALREITDKTTAFEAGAADYIIKPIEKVELLARIKNQLTIYKLQKELELSNKFLEKKVQERTSDLEKANSLLRENEEKLLTQNRDYIEVNEKLTKANLQLLAAKDKAEESEKLKDAFLANMSHEIRTPMNGIIGFCSLLRKKDLKEEKKDIYLTAINDSCEQLLTIVNGILDISKIEADQVYINNTAVSFKSWFSGIYQQFISIAKKKELNFILEANPKEFNETVILDSNKLQQVLGNLLSNAFKFTPKGCVTLGYKIQEDSILFYVGDTGIGISDENQKLVFERFRQGNIEIGRRYGGTGLGLTISQKLIQLLGGKIWVESKVCEGSTFYFTIPLRK